MTRAAAVRTTASRGATAREPGLHAHTTARPSTTARAATGRTSPRTATARTATAHTATARATTARAGAARTTGAPSGASRATLRPELRLVSTGAVAPRRRARAGLLSRRASFVLVVVALLALTTVGLLVLNTAIAVDSLKATELRAENAARAETVQSLEQRVVAGETPAEVARAAAAAGLVPAGVAGYLVLGPEGTTTMRGAPEPAPEPEPAPQPAPEPAPPGGN